MRFTLPTQALAEALGWIQRAVPSKPATPILGGVKVEVFQGQVTVSAFDYEQSRVATAQVSDSEDGVAVLGSRLIDIARVLPAGTVEVTVDQSTARIRSGRSRFSLPTMPAADYPRLPAPPAAAGTIDAAQFIDVVRRVAPAAGRDASIPVLIGARIVLDPAEGTMSIAATDRFRLAIMSLPYQPAEGAQPATFVVPARTLDEVVKNLGRDEQVIIGQDSTMFSLSTATQSATARLLDTEFVKVEQLMPAEFAATATGDVQALAEVVKRVSVVTSVAASKALLTFTEDGLFVSAQDDQGEDGEELVPGVSHTGDKFAVAFNTAFLTAGLAALGTPRFRLSMVAPNRAAILTSAEDGPSLRYLMMPVRVL